MQRKTLFISLITLGIILFVFFYLKNPNISNKPYITLVSDRSIDNYRGNAYYENGQTQANRIQIDLSKIKNAENAVSTINSYYWPRSLDGTYAVQSAQGELKLINLGTNTLETYKYPETPAYTVDYMWMGKNLIIHYYSANGITIPELNRDTPRNDHYYLFNTDTKKFTVVEVDEATSKYTAHGYNVYFSNKSDAENYFAINYCSKRDFLGECIKYGYSISNGSKIILLFELSNSEWGWTNDNFFVKNNGNVYLIDLKKIDW